MGGTVEAELPGHLGDLGQGALEVLVDVDGQGLERRDVDDRRTAPARSSPRVVRRGRRRRWPPGSRPGSCPSRWARRSGCRCPRRCSGQPCGLGGGGPVGEAPGEPGGHGGVKRLGGRGGRRRGGDLDPRWAAGRHGAISPPRCDAVFRGPTPPGVTGIASAPDTVDGEPYRPDAVHRRKAKEPRAVNDPEMPDLEIPDEVLAAVPEYEAGRGAVVIVDFQGVVLGMNKPAEELFGMESSDIAGEFVEMLVPAKKRWGHQAYRRGYLVEPRDREMDPGLYPEAETAEGEHRPHHRAAPAGDRGRQALRGRPHRPRRGPPPHRIGPGRQSPWSADPGQRSLVSGAPGQQSPRSAESPVSGVRPGRGRSGIPVPSTGIVVDLRCNDSADAPQRGAAGREKDQRRP